MRSEQVLSVGLKILGVYLVASAIVFFPQIAISFDLANEGGYNHPWLIAVTTLSSVMLSLLLGYFLAVRTHIVIGFLQKDKSKEHIDTLGIFLAQWIQLLGMLLFCISLGDLIDGVISAFVMQGSIAIHTSQIVPGLVSVIFGLAFVFKAPQIAVLLNKYSKK